MIQICNFQDVISFLIIHLQPSVPQEGYGLHPQREKDYNLCDPFLETGFKFKRILYID